MKDEQGAHWPPSEALAAHIQNYGGTSTSWFNGLLVQVSAWLPNFGYFECHRIDINDGPVVYVLPDELVPVNQLTVDYMKDVQLAAAVVYSDEVYELRDALDEIGIHVKAESIAGWDFEQKDRIRRYAAALKAGPTQEPVRPPELS